MTSNFHNAGGLLISPSQRTASLSLINFNCYEISTYLGSMNHLFNTDGIFLINSAHSFGLILFSCRQEAYFGQSRIWPFLSTVIVFRGTGPKPVIPFLQETAFN